jgi:hypothetical protein
MNAQDASNRKTFWCGLLLACAIHGQAQAADYVCGFASNPSAGGYSGEGLFTSDGPDPIPLACGQVQARRVQLQAYHALRHGQMTVLMAGTTQVVDPGYFEVKVYRVSQVDGGACRDEMEVFLSGALLYRGAALADFGASSSSADTSSGVVQLAWSSDAQGRETALIERSVSIASFSGTAAFTCRRVD